MKAPPSLFAPAAFMLLCIGSACGGSTIAPGIERSSLLGADVWASLEPDAEELLVALTRLDTRPSRGSTREAAVTLRDALADEGIEAKLLSAGGELIGVHARLRSDAPAARPLVLLSHLDTSSTEGGTWRAEAGPLSGARVDGAIWGRGVLDGKGLAVLHATALIALARAGARLERDVILLATPDGLLGGGAGLRAALKAHPELARAELVLTKGGGSLDDFLSDGRIIHAVATGEKGFARLAVTALARRAESARGEPVASRRLAAALTAVLDAPVVVRLTPSTLALLEHAAAGAPFPDRWLYGSAVLARTFVIGGLARNETTRSLVTEPVRVVSLRGGSGDGATVPRRASAELWASLLPGTTPGEMSSRVRVEILDSDVHVAIEAGAPASESGIHAALFELVKAQLAAPDSNEPIVPYLSPEPSDGRHLRAVGVPVYGVVPLRFSAADLNSIRGPDEHVAIAQLRTGIRAMTEIVGALAASNGSRPDTYSSK